MINIVNQVILKWLITEIFATHLWQKMQKIILVSVGQGIWQASASLLHSFYQFVCTSCVVLDAE